MVLAFLDLELVFLDLELALAFPDLELALVFLDLELALYLEPWPQLKQPNTEQESPGPLEGLLVE